MGFYKWQREECSGLKKATFKNRGPAETGWLGSLSSSEKSAFQRSRQEVGKDCGRSGGEIQLRGRGKALVRF